MSDDNRMGAGPQCTCNAKEGERHQFGCPINKAARDEESNWYWYGTKNQKCECGVASLGYDYGHSDWCPRYSKE